MAIEMLDTLGQKCPQPILKLTLKAADMKQGDILEVLGDSPVFEEHVRTWCERVGKLLVSVKEEGKTKKRIKIRF